MRQPTRMLRRIVAGSFVALLLAAVPGAPVGAAGPAAGPAAAPATAGGGAKVVRQRPCPGSEFTCVTLRVPRDHFNPADHHTLDVTFGLLRASGGPRKGVFVTITGGPGTSGLAAADSYTSVFDPAIPEQYDIVFLDQRGIGLSGALQCPDAALAFYSSDHVPTVSPRQARAYARDARAFSSDCVAETGVDPRALPFYGTRQAVEDLEAFRAWLGAPKLDLYGESYGTQYVQTYAAAHPDRLHSLMIDGPVDLTLDGTDFLAEQAGAFGDVLAKTLHRCTATAACRRQVRGADALDGYDALAARLRRGPIAYRYVRADGRSEVRRFGLGDLETAAAGYVYSTYDRMLFQRALAWASRGQLLPMARLASLSLGQDPDSGAAIPDPSWSDALYYAVECMDYAYGSGSTRSRQAAYLAAGERADVDEVRLGSIFYGDLPCVSWPVHGSAARPEYLRATPYPVFVLASTWDPATPYAGALRIYRHLSDGYLVVQPGGAHIIFGRGNACPDELVTAFLLTGERPEQRRTTCEEPMGADDYVPVPKARVTGYRDALAAMTAMDDEINTSADYWAWDGAGALRYGCQFGGSIRYTAFVDGYRARLSGCAFTGGLPLDGRAVIDDTNGTFTLTVTSPGGTRLVYVRDADGNRSVTGRWFGTPVSIAA